MSFPASTTLADAGEFDLVRHLVDRTAQAPHVFLGAGDDAAVVRTPKGHVVVSTDMLVENQHFRREWASAADIGHRAAAANLSDINAMGGMAHSLTVAIGAPAHTPAQWVLDLADGIAAEAAMVGAVIIGGDITRAEEVVVSITAMGACELAPTTRGGARPGDIVAMAGRQGWSAAGLAVLKRGFRSPRALVRAFQRPEPTYDAGPAAAKAGATAMIDVSDGLLGDLGHIAGDSGVTIDIERAAFELAEPMHAVGSALGVDPMQFVLSGGEDYAIVATFGAKTNLPGGFAQIGVVTDGEAGEVLVDGEPYEGPRGHTHFN